MVYSILDTDLYKFTVSYAYMKLFPNAECTFTFKDRNNVKRTPQFLKRFKAKLKEFCENACLTPTEFHLLTESHRSDFIPTYYWEWLYSFRFDYNKIKVYLDEDDVLCMEVTDKCYKCTLYEIPCMFLIPEVNNEGKVIDWEYTMNKLKEKVEIANDNGMLFSEFGTRRRFSQEVQDKVCKYLKENAKTCVGTSNVYLALKYGMKPIGTHPHEWFMFHGAQYGYDKANYLALENWTSIYDGDLGIALSDCYGCDIFFKDFSLKLSKLFDGVRQDSGDEYEFCNKTINHYKSKGINPLTKTIVFSNSLNFPKAIKILNYCKGKIKCSFGIGTDITCDVYGKYDMYGNPIKYDSENIVMKMTLCRMTSKENWKYCIKLSDDFEKAIGNKQEIEYCKYKINQILNGVN